MAVKIVKIGKDNLGQVIKKGLEKPINMNKVFFQQLLVSMDRKTIETFKNNGYRQGHPKWAALKRSTVVSEGLGRSTFNIRYGTDGTPKPIYKKGDGQLRKFRKGVRRYQGIWFNILRASGSFAKTFKKLSLTQKRLIYGTRHEKAKAIMSNPDRQVLFVTAKDMQEYNRMYKNFVDRNIKF